MTEGYGYLLRRAYLGIRRKLKRAIAPLGLTPDQYSVLYVLDARRGRRQKELAEDLFMDANTLTAILRRLEEKGLVRRAADERDRRAVLVRLTAAGSRSRRSAMAAARALKAEATRSMTASEREALRRLLRTFSENVADD